MDIFALHAGWTRHCRACMWPRGTQGNEWLALLLALLLCPSMHQTLSNSNYKTCAQEGVTLLVKHRNSVQDPSQEVAQCRCTRDAQRRGCCCDVARASPPRGRHLAKLREKILNGFKNLAASWYFTYFLRGLVASCRGVYYALLRGGTTPRRKTSQHESA